MIVFLSMVDPSLDWDLLPFWIDHYNTPAIDRHIIVLHRRPDNAEIVDMTRPLLEANGWECRECTGEFNSGWLQHKALTAIREHELSQGDFIVAADSDEFHDISSYSRLAGEYDLVTGMFCDRWDDTLHFAEPGVPLAKQYPHAGDIYEAARSIAAGDNSPNWSFPVNKTKVLMFRNDIPVLSNGHHDNPALPGLRSKGHAVYHYPWRPGFVSRMISRSYHKPWFIATFLHMFNAGPDNVDRIVFERWSAQRQKAMGWEPCAG